MEYRPGFRRLVASHQGSTSAVEQVAHQGPSIFQATSEGPSRITGHPTARGQSPRPSSEGSCVDRQGTSDEIGGGNGSCGRVRPHFLAFARCVEESEEFIERAKKRIIGCQAEVSQAQEAFARVQSKLEFEEQGLADGEARLAALIQESAAAGPRVEEVPATLPANFAHELQELRACLSELRKENTELRAQLQSGRGEERERKHPRSLATSSLELAFLSRAGAECGPGVGQSVPLMGDASFRMETLVCVRIDSTPCLGD